MNRLYALLVFALYVLSLGLSGSKADVPNLAQLDKLVQAVWAGQPVVHSLDMVIYQEKRNPEFDPNFYRSTHQSHFDHLGGGSKAELKGKALEDRIAIEETQVELTRKKAELGEFVKERIRITENYVRIDRTSGNPEITLFAGTPREERIPARPLGSETAYTRTTVYLWDANQVRALGSSVRVRPSKGFEYDHEHKVAVAKLEDDRLLGVKPPIVRLWLSDFGIFPDLSPWITWLGTRTDPSPSGQETLGATGDFRDPVYRQFVPDKQKVELLSQGKPISLGNDGQQWLQVTVVVEQANQVRLDRYEAVISDRRTGQQYTAAVVAFDAADYSKCYQEEYYYSLQRVVPARVISRSDFDGRGIPRQTVVLHYDFPSGRLKGLFTFRIEAIELNCDIPFDVFEFAPPKGYQIAKSSRSPLYYYRRGEEVLAVPMED